jgi:hypothetical protein
VTSNFLLAACSGEERLRLLRIELSCPNHLWEPGGRLRGSVRRQLVQVALKDLSPLDVNERMFLKHNHCLAWFHWYDNPG